MIPENHNTAVISTGLHFMRAITEAYGADEGMQLWEQIASVLDPDVKGQIFFAMLTGTHNDTVVVRGVNLSSLDKVKCVKEIRNWSGLGLKEAVDFCNQVYHGGVARLTVKPAEHHMAVIGLRNVGFVI